MTNKQPTITWSTWKFTRLYLVALLIHVTLVFLVLDIYFRSPLIHGMEPHRSQQPFAKRLVLFVADGLRAEGIYPEKHQERVPYLTSLRKSGKAAWGIVKTQVPTESRPGHAAILGGVYEDPSAIFTGWTANIVEFDTVLNRSANAWSYGSPDIVKIFPKNDRKRHEIASYRSEDEDFSGNKSTTWLDDWTFKKFRSIFPEDKKACGRFCESGNLFFLHLLGMDTVGHVHKPDSPMYVENLKFVDEEIKKIVALTEGYFQDDETVFVFTSDHGMTNWGSHGDGSDDETEVPFILWGKGINRSAPPLDIKQADLAPLISSLLGIEIPVNSEGILHHELLNGTESQIRSAILTNMKQLAEQYYILRDSLQVDLFYSLKTDEFAKITGYIANFGDLSVNSSVKVQEDSTQRSLEILAGIKRLRNYYYIPKIATVATAFFLWIVYLVFSLQKLMRVVRKAIIFRLQIGVVALSAIVAIYMIAIKSNVTSYIYLVFLGGISICVLRSNTLEKLYVDILRKDKVLYAVVAVFVVLTECLVYAFYNKFACLVVLLVLAVNYSRMDWKIPEAVRLWWLLGCVLSMVLLVIPVYRKFSYLGLALGIANWSVYALAQRARRKTHQHTFVPLVLFPFAAYNAYRISQLFDVRYGVPILHKIVSWGLSGVALGLIPFSSINITRRFHHVCSCLIIPYVLMSVYVDVTFFTILTLMLYVWMIMEAEIYDERSKFEFEIYKLNVQPVRNGVDFHDYRRTFVYLSLTITSFFTSGNIASLNGFDPIWTRAFVSTFSPFLMTSLIVFKMCIPFLMISCAYHGVNIITRSDTTVSFTIVLVFCDQMVLNFMFLVRSEGSWKEIGMSLSHFIIMNVMVLVMILFYLLAKFITTVRKVVSGFSKGERDVEVLGLDSVVSDGKGDVRHRRRNRNA